MIIINTLHCNDRFRKCLIAQSTQKMQPTFRFLSATRYKHRCGRLYQCLPRVCSRLELDRATRSHGGLTTESHTVRNYTKRGWLPTCPTTVTIERRPTWLTNCIRQRGAGMRRKKGAPFHPLFSFFFRENERSQLHLAAIMVCLLLNWLSKDSLRVF